MSIAIGEDLRLLHETAARVVADRCPPAVARAAMGASGTGVGPEGDEGHRASTRPPFWDEIAALGWLGLAVPEDLGGQGAGMVEQAVVLEQLGHAVAPGPVLPTVWAAGLLALAEQVALVAEHDDSPFVDTLADLAAARRVGAVALPPDPAGATGVAAAASQITFTPVEGTTTAGTLDGTVTPVLGAPDADVLIVPALAASAPGGSPGEVDEIWCLVEARHARVVAVPALDGTRRLGSVRVTEAPATVLSGIGRPRVEAVGIALAAAEAAGGAAWCVETAASHAVERRQFGRPIGQFQAVKHRCADMLVRLEQARAAAWDAAVALDGDEPHTAEAHLATNVAGAIALDAFVEVAKDCIQVLGGIGFTWEHDAHLYLRRATALRQIFGGGAPWRAAVATAALAGTRRHLSLALPPEAEDLRADIAETVDAIAALPKDQRRGPLADAGLIVPHWPAPWGRDAGAVEQIVIDQEMRRARVRAPHLQVGAWAAPTIAAHGTPEQQERWVRPTLHGEITWCQLFSEPEAGSDLAALTTRATRTDGGWLLEGQKVWTTMAKEADWGICLARTDPDAPKHQGITYFVVDMTSPGIDIRPLRELTGLEMFNEVFFDGTFVADDCVIGEVDGGWPLARTTLANERVSMGSGSSFGGGIETLVGLVGERVDDGRIVADALLLDALGALVAEAHSLAVMGLRTTLRSLTGARPGSEASVRKLLGVEHDQRTQELGLALLGPEGATVTDAGAQWSFGFLANRCLTIAGGTSEIQRNVIGERLLGMPRDPEPGR